MEWEITAQLYAALGIRAKTRLQQADGSAEPDYQGVDVDRLDVVRVRGVGIDPVAVSARRQVELDRKLNALSFTGPQVNTAVGALVARMAAPSSELAIPEWLRQHLGLDELIEADFHITRVTRWYRVTDRLYANEEA